MPVARRDPKLRTPLSAGTRRPGGGLGGRVESRLPGEMKAGEKEIMSRKELDKPRKTE